MNKNKPVTIKDVARSCGVSMVTVSRVLSGSDYPVKDETREKVLKAAEALNYQPNLLARGLKTNKTTEIVVVVPSITNPFYTSIITGVENVAIKNGYSVTLFNCANRHGSTVSIIESIVNRRVDKVVLSTGDSLALQVKKLLSKHVKVVLVDCWIPEVDCHRIYFDYRKGARMITEYLINKGHRRFVYLGLKPDSQTRIDRVEGFKDALKDADLEFSDDFIIYFDESEAMDSNRENIEFKADFALANDVLASPVKPTAIVAANDMMALGVLSYCNSVNIKVPDDISVVGFDDSIFSELSHPAITTIRVPAEYMGEMAAKLLFNEEESNTPKYNIVLEPELIVRNSVKVMSDMKSIY